MQGYGGGLPRILKFVRLQRGLTQDQLAERLSVSASLIAKFETNRLTPKPDTARHLDAVLGTDDLFQGLADEARSWVGEPAWMRPWLELERQAAMIRCFELVAVPGLLQTEDYARAILSDAGTRVTDVEEAVNVRMGRSAVLEGKPPCRLVAIVDEMVLRRPVGSPKVMADQCHAIVQACQRRNVDVAVVPATVGAYPGLNGPLAVASVNGRAIGFVDEVLGGRVVDDPEMVLALEEVWEGIRGYALPGRPSLELIMEVAESWS